VDFFESQDHARKQTGRLVALFAFAVVAIACTLYVVAVVATGYRGNDPRTGAVVMQLVWLDPNLMATVALATLVLVGGGSLYKMAQLRSGGGRSVAESLGGRLLHGDSSDALERRILNVVEEMAIAAGTTVPPVYLMDREEGINAFAAGFAPTDAVVAVTRGCAETLTRDELQGVVAHEFSHILNGDMRLNIRLMGILHGILIIGILGYFVMRSSMFAGHSRRSDRGNAGMVLLFVGVALAAIGFLGTFFGNMIKATVSRQREFLADASAVQFTRNPDGIAGALKKIGGFERGSKLESANAPEVSHAFFASGLSGALGSVFSTHPPLEQRIGRLDPSWQPAEGARAPRTSEAPASATAGFGGAAFSGSAPAPAPAAVGDALRHVGSPTPAHVSYAKGLVERLPAAVVSAAHEPYSARALVYSLLVSQDASVRTRQLFELERRVESSLLAEVNALLPSVDGIDRAAKLPVIDICLPALLELTAGQYQEFAGVVPVLMAADDRLDLFEWALQRVLLTHLAPAFESKPRRSRVRFSGLRRLRPQLSALLSTLAQVHPEDPARVQRAFDAGAQRLAEAGRAGVSLLPLDQCGLAALDEALSDLADAAPRLKRAIVLACAEAVCSDGRLTVEEGELLRAVSDALGCPMPPVLAGSIVTAAS
jgi:Zn-dependent protease with chaperone function